MRVAATSALGTDYLCRKDVTTMGLFGSGHQGRANLLALLHIRPTLKRVVVFSPNAENRKQFAARMADGDRHRGGSGGYARSRR